MKAQLIVYGKIFLILIVFFAVLLTLTGIATYAYFANNLKTKERIMNNNNTGVVMLDRNGKPFFAFYEGKKREIVGLQDISPSMQHAVIAAEDKEFYLHHGVSLRGIIRSFIYDLQRKDLAFGGSTITQQLVKNALLTSSRSFLRKYQEAVLANEIEKRYTKQEILEMYLNSVYFGQGVFGAEEAAQHYFGKSAKELTLPEAAMLAAFLPSPSLLSSMDQPTPQAIMRKNLILAEMVRLNYITPQQYADSLNVPLLFQKSDTTMNTRAPHYALMVRDILLKKFGEEEVVRSGFTIKTSLDLNLQDYVEEVIAENVSQLSSHRVTNAATVVLDVPTRQVLSLVGSVDWYDNSFGKVNMATSPRQPGSSFKPIVYATAFDEEVITPETILHDVPTTFHENGPQSPEYKPKDYDGKYRGLVTPRRALANSLNIPSVEVMSRLDIPDVLNTARHLGISTLKDPSNYGLSLVLGTGEIPLIEMTNAYAAFADSGQAKETVLVTEIMDKNGDKVYESKSYSRQVFSPEASYLISSILSDNYTRAEVFGNALTIDKLAAVKTGTTENYRDAWTLGYTPQVAVGVWVGNNDGALMDNVAGSLGAAPIWKSVMTHYLAGKPVSQFTKPDGIVTASVCSSSGLRQTTATTSASTEYFMKGTEPQGKCNNYTPIASVKKSPTSHLTPSVNSPAAVSSPAQTFNYPPRRVVIKSKENKR